MIELRALGGLRLRDSADGHEILSVLARTKPSGLLVYLALSPPNVSHGRDELFELLWPDSRRQPQSLVGLQQLKSPERR